MKKDNNRVFIVNIKEHKKFFFFDPYQLMQELFDYYKVPYEMMTKEEFKEKYGN